ncbi:HAD family hydrolase [Rhodopila sp.]|uniref:HAD family hydrolase n=1 Tax=Rhodopila sp. TaxID=2480087 RepID=UPI002BE8A53C|nr:HAD family hydrolase [Rhodopila sp.]HVZ08850.1 HAD family hydrolase [Rhodopila sp.]
MSTPTERPTVLLYDWDNTLVDAWAGITAALNAAFAAFALPAWTVEDTRNRVRVSMRESFPVMFGDRWEEARDIFYRSLTRNHLDHVTPMPEVATMLRAGSRLPQGVVSNKNGTFLRREVAHLGWADYFGAVVGAGDAVIDKPDPAPLLLALGRMGVTPTRSVWYIGDTALDMVAARAAGLTAVLLGDAGHDGGVDRASPDLHFRDAGALASRICDLT